MHIYCNFHIVEVPQLFFKLRLACLIVLQVLLPWKSQWDIRQLKCLLLMIELVSDVHFQYVEHHKSHYSVLCCGGRRNLGFWPKPACMCKCVYRQQAIFKNSNLVQLSQGSYINPTEHIHTLQYQKSCCSLIITYLMQSLDVFTSELQLRIELGTVNLDEKQWEVSVFELIHVHFSGSSFQIIISQITDLFSDFYYSLDHILVKNYYSRKKTMAQT